MHRLRGDRPRRLDIETEQSSHRPLAERHGLLHRASAEFDEARRIGDRDRACCRQGRVFAEGMTRDVGDMPAKHETAFRLENPNHREARRQQRGLGVFGQDEIAFRPFEHQAREVLRQRLVDFLEEVAGRANVSARLRPMPTACDPWPGKTNARFIQNAVPYPPTGTRPLVVIAPLPPVSRTGFGHDGTRTRFPCRQGKNALFPPRIGPPSPKNCLK